jgi:hypothetical protein
VSLRQVELVLKKQRLQLRSAMLRDDIAAYAAGWAPAFALAERGRSALHWVRRHPVLPVMLLAAVLAARPRAMLRWAQRGFVAWQALRKLRSMLRLGPGRSL